MPVEREAGGKSHFLASVADCDKKKSALLTWNNAEAVCWLENASSGLSFPHALGLLKEVSLVSKAYPNLPWDLLVEFRGP